jgi:hypothetical protein
MVTPAEDLPLPPGEKGKGPAPVTTTARVVEQEEDEEDLQLLSRRPRQPPGKILGQGTSGAKRVVEEEAVIVPPPPKRTRSTAGRRASCQPSIVLSNSDETVSDHEALADVLAVGAKEEEDEDAVVDPEPPAPMKKKTLPVVVPGIAPETSPAVTEETRVTVPTEVVAAHVHTTASTPIVLKKITFRMKKISP